jgi:hypothetical protein
MTSPSVTPLPINLSEPWRSISVKIKKLCVGVPHTGSIRTETVQCLIATIFKTVAALGCGLHTVMPYGCYIDENRTEIAKEALAIGASHIMFIDSDMAFPDNGILTLSSRDKRVIGANYNRRTFPLTSTVKISDEKGQLVEVPGENIPTYPFKCYSVATGFMLVQTDVFKELEKPWFFYEYDAEKDATVGEDVYFCKKLRGKGINIWCDPTIEVKHIGDYAY